MNSLSNTEYCSLFHYFNFCKNNTSYAISYKTAEIKFNSYTIYIAARVCNSEKDS